MLATGGTEVLREEKRVALIPARSPGHPFLYCAERDLEVEGVRLDAPDGVDIRCVCVGVDLVMRWSKRKPRARPGVWVRVDVTNDTSRDVEASVYLYWR